MQMLPCFCAQTRRAARMLTLRYDAELSKAGLSASQFELLALLAAGERNGRGIAGALALDVTTVSRNLKPLLADGLLAARTSDTDARQVLYALTPGGRQRLRTAMKHWQHAQNRVTQNLGRHAQPTLIAVQQLSGAAA